MRQRPSKPRRAVKDDRSEHDEQRDLLAALRAMRIEAIAIPNAGKRSARTAAYLKAEGMRKGAPDLVLLDLAADGAPVAVEMKCAQGGRVEEPQRIVHALMRSRGWHIVVAHGYMDALTQLRALGVGRWRN